MQPIISTALLLAILHHLPTTLGETACTKQTAGTYVDGCSAAQIAADDTGCVKEVCAEGGTPESMSAALQACFCNALNESNCGSTVEERRELGDAKEKRQDFTCSDNEQCYINTADGGLFCLNEATGDYEGESGDSGNVDTEAYTPASGWSATPAATTTGGSKTTAVDSSSASKTATTTSSAKTTSKSTSATATSGSATVASTTTQTGGLSKATAGAALGLIGLAVGFVL